MPAALPSLTRPFSSSFGPITFGGPFRYGFSRKIRRRPWPRRWRWLDRRRVHFYQAGRGTVEKALIRDCALCVGLSSAQSVASSASPRHWRSRPGSASQAAWSAWGRRCRVSQLPFIGSSTVSNQEESRIGESGGQKRSIGSSTTAALPSKV